MNKCISAIRKMMPVLLGMLLATISAHTAIADHKPNHAPNDNSLAMMIIADFSDDCRSVTASSEKDLSNVVLLFMGDTWEKFDDLDVPMDTFAGTGDNEGKVILIAYIKSGSFKLPIDVLNSDSGKMKMIKVGNEFTCSPEPLA